MASAAPVAARLAITVITRTCSADQVSRQFRQAIYIFIRPSIPQGRLCPRPCKRRVNGA
jgi:hypothetical protein